MVKTEIAPLVCVLLLGAIATLTGMNAECCHNTHLFRFVAAASIVNRYICYDGTEAKGFVSSCGVGDCNIFGCNCVGGCRKSSKGYDKLEAERLYFYSHGFTKKEVDKVLKNKIH